MALRQQLVLLACLAVPSMTMRMQKTRAAMDEEERAQWCWGSSWSKLKEYYFEGMFDLPDSEDHTSLQLVRDPEHPVLRIHKVSQWVVRGTPKNDEEDPNANLPWHTDARDSKLQWLAACMKPEGQDGCKPEDITEIKLLDVDYITMIPEINVTDPNTGLQEAEMGLKMKLADGSVTEFAGGLYLPRKLMTAAMKRAESDYGKFSGLGQEAKESASERDNMISSGLKAWGKGFKGGSSTGVATGAAIGTAVGATLVIAGVPVAGAGIVGTLLMGAGAGLVGGSAAGLAIGAVLGTVVGGGAALYDYHKQKRELKLSAVEKMWSKLECHQHFYHCNKTFIVPKGKTCPEPPACENIEGAMGRNSEAYPKCKCKDYGHKVMCDEDVVSDRKFDANDVFGRCALPRCG